MQEKNSYEAVLDFWFNELDASQWFTKDEELDATIRERFLSVHGAAMKNELEAWRTTPRGRLAEIIVLDQFSRNMFRGEAKAFLSDDKALALAKEAVTEEADVALSPVERRFLYMPYMHSEDAAVHEEAVKLFTALGNKEVLHYEMLHKDIIDRFGRYPSRNEELGRTSTEEEIEFLKEHKGF